MAVFAHPALTVEEKHPNSGCFPYFDCATCNHQVTGPRFWFAGRTDMKMESLGVEYVKHNKRLLLRFRHTFRFTA
jgi:hypothetical protein